MSTPTDRPFLTTLSQVTSLSLPKTHTHTEKHTRAHRHSCTYTDACAHMHIHMNIPVYVHHTDTWTHSCTCVPRHHHSHSYVHTYDSAIYFFPSSYSIYYHCLSVYMCSIGFLYLNVTSVNIRVLFALRIVTSQATSPVPSTLRALTKNCCMLNEPSKISLILNRFWKQKSSPLIKQKNKNRKGLL